MKSVFLMLGSISALTVALAAGAAEGSVSIAEATETNQPACYMQEQRKTKLCQKIMFPSIPFR